MTGKNLIFIIGPTGCGKTTNAAKLAEYFGCANYIDDMTAQEIARLLNKTGYDEKLLVLSSLTSGVIREAFPDSSIHNFFDAMRKARMVVAPQWILDRDATARSQQQASVLIPNSPTLAVLGEIQTERARQVEKGFDASHDDRYTRTELPMAAVSYALNASVSLAHVHCPFFWPWDVSTFKPESRRADLIKAAALLVAEIERMDRVDAGEHDHRCNKAPAGYQCTRLAGHDGPCAAVDNNTAGEP